MSNNDLLLFIPLFIASIFILFYILQYNRRIYFRYLNDIFKVEAYRSVIHGYHVTAERPLINLNRYEELKNSIYMKYWLSPIWRYENEVELPIDSLSYREILKLISFMSKKYPTVGDAIRHHVTIDMEKKKWMYCDGNRIEIPGDLEKYKDLINPKILILRQELFIKILKITKVQYFN